MSIKLNNPNKEVCRLCGVELEYSEDNAESTVWHEISKHKSWCPGINYKIQQRFDRTFGQVYNILELVLDGVKLEHAKTLIGQFICDTRNDCWDIVKGHMDKQ